MKANTPNILFLLIIMLSQGCALDLPEPLPAAPRVDCTQNIRMPRDELCEVGFCVAPNQQTQNIAIQLTPPNTADFAAAQFPLVELRPGAALPDLELQRPRLMKGNIEVAGEGGGLIEARVILQRANNFIEGRSLRYEIQSTRDQGYSLRLPEGDYDIQILPSRSDLPPQQLRRFPVRADLEHVFVLEAPTRSIQVTGRVVLNNEEDTQALSRVRINALDSLDTVVSATTETDEEGLFTLAVRSDIQLARLVLSPQGEDRNQGLVLPRVFIEDIQLTGQSINLGDLSMGQFNPSARQAAGLVLGPDGERIQGATMIFQGNVGEGVITRALVTDKDGYFGILLAPGTYKLLVTPPESTPYVTTERTELVVPAEGSIAQDFETLTLDTKPSIRGSLRYIAQNLPVAQTNLTFRATRLWDVRRFDVTRTYTTRTDAQGNFSLQAEPGLYDVEIAPPTTSGLARSLQRDIDIEGPDVPLTLTANQARVAYGTVIDADRQPVSDVQVEIFSLEDQTRLIGTGITNTEGVYRVLLPAQP